LLLFLPFVSVVSFVVSIDVNTDTLP